MIENPRTSEGVKPMTLKDIIEGDYSKAAFERLVKKALPFLSGLFIGAGIVATLQSVIPLPMTTFIYLVIFFAGYSIGKDTGEKRNVK